MSASTRNDCASGSSHIIVGVPAVVSVVSWWVTISPGLVADVEPITTLPFRVDIVSLSVVVTCPFAKKFPSADVSHLPSMVAPFVTLNVLIPVGNLNESEFGTVKTVVNLPWASVVKVPLQCALTPIPSKNALSLVFGFSNSPVTVMSTDLIFWTTSILTILSLTSFIMSSTTDVVTPVLDSLVGVTLLVRVVVVLPAVPVTLPPTFGIAQLPMPPPTSQSPALKASNARTFPSLLNGIWFHPAPIRPCLLPLPFLLITSIGSVAVSDVDVVSGVPAHVCCHSFQTVPVPLGNPAITASKLPSLLVMTSGFLVWSCHKSLSGVMVILPTNVAISYGLTFNSVDALSALISTTSL